MKAFFNSFLTSIVFKIKIAISVAEGEVLAQFYLGSINLERVAILIYVINGQPKSAETVDKISSPMGVLPKFSSEQKCHLA